MPDKQRIGILGAGTWGMAHLQECWLIVIRK